MPRRERLVVESELRQRPGTEVLDHDVGLRDQALEHRAALRLLEVERHAFLVAVDAQEIRALAADETADPSARVSSPLPGCSILMTRAPMSASSIVQYGPGEHAREVEHGHAVEWRHNGQDDYRLRRQRLTQLRAGERVAFTRRRAVHCATTSTKTSVPTTS